MNFKRMAANMLRGCGHTYNVVGDGRTFVGYMAKDQQSIQIAPDVELVPGDCISDGFKSNLVLSVNETNTLPEAALTHCQMVATVLRSIDGPRDQFGRSAATMQTVAESVPVAFTGPGDAMAPARYGVKVGDVLRLPKEDQVVLSCGTRSGITVLRTQQLDGSDLAARIFSA